MKKVILTKYVLCFLILFFFQYNLQASNNTLNLEKTLSNNNFEELVDFFEDLYFNHFYSHEWNKVLDFLIDHHYFGSKILEDQIQSIMFRRIPLN